MSHQLQIVIIGGGFGGLAVVRQLGDVEAGITLIDRRNFHLFQPLLYQVATGGLSPANISAPLRALFKKQKNVEVLLGDVTDIDVSMNTVVMESGKRCHYDYLVVAAGASHNYFEHPEWRADAPGLKTVEDALEIRGKVLSSFEAAEAESDAHRQKDLMRFVVIGGGPTGVELAGALGEIAHHTLKGNFRHIDPADAEIILLEGGNSILSSYSPELAQRAREALCRLGVTVRERTVVKEIKEGRIVVECNGQRVVLMSSCVVWAAGVQASSLGQILAQQTGVQRDRAGRVHVTRDLSIPNHPNMFVIGDLALILQDGRAVPGVAPAAMQAGGYVGRVLRARIERSHKAPGFFCFRDKGAMAVVGRSFAVVQLGCLELAGFFAWLIWLCVHIFSLAVFTNRLLVAIQWGWSYFTRNRSARLITGPPLG